MSLQPKSDSKDLEWKFPKVLIRISWNFVCKSEIAFWCTCDQKILKTFKYLKVWIKNGIKVTFPSKSDSEDLERKFKKCTR